MLSYRSSAEAVLVLGGHETREKFAADLAKENPNLEVWISSGSPSSYVKKIFNHWGVPSDRLHLDYQAQDTVTNFTTIVKELKVRDIDSASRSPSEPLSKSLRDSARAVFWLITGNTGSELDKIIDIDKH